MCGIAGAIGTVDAVVADAVRRMSHGLRHRGPDDDGFWTSDGETGAPGVALAHRRLAILDLSPAGHQPMVDPATGNQIVFNGEVYNFAELRKEFEADGDTFRSHCDTEVILRAYARLGANCLQRFRGMFAFAIWDASRRELFFARDRIGKKPLYLYQCNDGARRCVLFASEVRAMLDSNLVPRRLDRTGLSTYLWNGFVVGPSTIIAGVEEVPAGSHLTISLPELKRTGGRYWSIPPARAVAGTEQLAHELRQSVRLRLISDVPLGVFLSGGVDSSAIAALAVEAAQGPVRTFNVAFDEAEYNEARYARAVARSLGTEHHEIRFSQQDFVGRLEDALNSFDQPTFDAINSFVVSRAARDAGITVALAGTGGDELFGGYRSFSDLPRAGLWGDRLAWVPEGVLRAAANAVTRWKMGPAGEVPPQTRWAKLGDALATRGRMLELYQLAYGLFLPPFIERLRGTSNTVTHFGLPTAKFADLERLTAGSSNLHAISMMELSCFIGERLMRDTDAASMAASLEVRVPLLDHAVIASAAALPDNVRFSPVGKKQLLRRLALGKLDPGIFDRPKSGFVLPIDTWCRQQLGGEIESTFADRDRCESIGLNPNALAGLWRSFRANSPGIYWSRVWALFVLLWWCRKHRVSL